MLYKTGVRGVGRGHARQLDGSPPARLDCYFFFPFSPIGLFIPPKDTSDAVKNLQRVNRGKIKSVLRNCGIDADLHFHSDLSRPPTRLRPPKLLGKLKKRENCNFNESRFVSVGCRARNGHSGANPSTTRTERFLLADILG